MGEKPRPPLPPHFKAVEETILDSIHLLSPKALCRHYKHFNKFGGVGCSNPVWASKWRRSIWQSDIDGWLIKGTPPPKKTNKKTTTLRCPRLHILTTTTISNSMSLCDLVNRLVSDRNKQRWSSYRSLQKVEKCLSFTLTPSCRRLLQSKNTDYHWQQRCKRAELPQEAVLTEKK